MMYSAGKERDTFLIAENVSVMGIGVKGLAQLLLRHSRDSGKFLSLNFLLHKGRTALSSELSGMNWANKILGQAPSGAQVPSALHLWVHP